MWKKKRKVIIGIACRQWRQYNAIGVISDYINALSFFNASVLLIPLQKHKQSFEILKLCNGLLVSGGEDIAVGVNLKDKSKSDVQRDEFELQLIESADILQMPFLGICRGMHLLNVYYGGTVTLINKFSSKPLCHITDWQNGEIYNHHVKIIDESKLERIFRTTKAIRVNGNHNYCLNKIGERLRIAAFSSDGVIEAVESTTSRFCLGVQWHPECLVYRNDPYAELLFQAFCKACKDGKKI